MKFIYPEGATPLEIDEIRNLLLHHISTQKELDEAEAENIIQARQWVLVQRQKDILTIPFLLKVHTKMFDRTWKWAGKYRSRTTNIGIEPYRIPIELECLLRDVKFWVDNSTYTFHEIAVRFHHKLVWIHPFVNGNGRHARLMTDLLLRAHKHQAFTWGKNNLALAGDARKSYIESLRQADQHDYSALLQFVRS